MASGRPKESRTARRTAARNRYEIIGERGYHAALEVGLRGVPGLWREVHDADVMSKAGRTGLHDTAVGASAKAKPGRPKAYVFALRPPTRRSITSFELKASHRH